MQKYQGTKTVEAEPMTLGEFVQKSGRNPYGKDIKNHEETEQGYHVRYADGYESWSPKDVFEEAYKLADTALDRMLIEGSDLTNKVDKLMAFANSDKFKTLDKVTQAMLDAQVHTMQDYQQELNVRYAKMENGIGSFKGFNFGIAISLLRHGYALCRKGWNGKGMFVVKQIPAHISSDVIPNMTSLPQSAKDIILKGLGYISYANQMLIYNEMTGRADSWVPSSSDVFAEDWGVYTGK